jgi:hypothetical protein
MTHAHRSFWAVFVAPPCWVTRGRQRIFTALLQKASSVALLDQTKASPGRRFAIFSGVSEPSAAFAFWMCLSHAGELNLWRMTWLDSSMSGWAPRAGPDSRP